jgi:hypothetical protein
MANNEDLPPSLRGATASDDLPPSLRASASGNDLPPSLRDQSAQSIPSQIMSGAVQDVKDIASMPLAIGKKLAQMGPGIIDPMGATVSEATSGTMPQDTTLGQAVTAGVDSVKGMASHVKDLVTHPVDTFIKHPVMTLMDIATVAFPASEALSSLKSASSMSKVAQIEALAGKVGEAESVARGAMPTVQPELGLTGEAAQPRMFELLPKPTQDGVTRITEAMGKKYGGVSSHMPETIQDVAAHYAKDPAEASAYVDKMLPRMIRVSKDESGFGYVNALGESGTGKSIPFPNTEIANQFKQELFAKLQADPLLQPETMRQLGLFGPREGTQNLIEAPKPVQGEGFTMSNDPKPAETPAPAPEGTPTQPMQAPAPTGEQGSFGFKGTSNAEIDAAKFRTSPQGKLQEAVESKTLPDQFLKGAPQRLAKIADHVQSGDLPDVGRGFLGTVDRTRFDVKMGGKGQSVWYEQRQAMADQMVKARTATIKDITEMDKFGIKPGTPEDYAVKVYGESANKEVAYQGMVKQFGADSAKQIKSTAEGLRPVYDRYWTEVNKVRLANNLDPIPYRQDYFTHGQELTVLHDMGLLETGDTAKLKAATDAAKQASRVIDSDGRFVKIKNMVFNFTRRLGGEDNLGAVDGYRRYVAASNQVIHMQPVVNELQQAARLLQKTNPKAAEYIGSQANALAGLPSSMDRGVVEVTSKDFLRAYSKMTQNMVSNIVQLNPRISISQLMGTIPTFAEYPTRDFVSAGHSLVTNGKLRDFAMAHSPTLQDRALDLLEHNIDAGLIRKASNSMIGYSDIYVAMHSWMTAFKSAVRGGAPIDEAIARAENFTARAQGFTNRVNTSPLLRSKAFQSIAPLQNQSLAFSKYLAQDLWEGKTVTAKTLSAFKLAIAGGSAAAADYLIFGKMGGGIVQVSDFIPLSGTLRHGLGGPVLGAVARVVGAANSGDVGKAATETAKAGLLLQTKVPGGLQISKGLQALYDYTQGQ